MTGTSALADNRPHEQDGDDDRRDPEPEREQRREQADLNAHPFALSTSNTLNGWPPCGVTWNVSPQCPTITSAGAAWE
jgi:hypothetical protein